MFERKKVPLEKIPRAVIAKWSPDVLDEGFTPLPKRLLRSLSRIFSDQEGVADLQVVMAIADYLRPDLARGPSIEFLAFTAGMTPADFRKRLDRLVDRGWVRVGGSDQALDLSLSGLLAKITQET